MFEIAVLFVNSVQNVPKLGRDMFILIGKSRQVIGFGGKQHLDLLHRFLSAVGDVAAQTQRAFENIEKVLKAAGCSFDDVIKMNMYLVSAADYKPMNEVRKRVFRAPYPASTVVVVKELVLPDLLVEVEVIAKRRA